MHFYQPIPDTQSLPETLWTRPSELVGTNMNDSGQLDLLRKHFPKFRDEYEQFPTTPAEEPGHFYLNNHRFDSTDAFVAYCMVRHFQPQLIIEVGSGFSSLLLGQAATKNNSGEVSCIEPFPQEFLKRGFPGLHSLIEKKIQDVDLDFFFTTRLWRYPVYRQFSHAKNWRGRQLSILGSPATPQTRCHCACP